MTSTNARVTGAMIALGVGRPVTASSPAAGKKRKTRPLAHVTSGVIGSIAPFDVGTPAADQLAGRHATVAGGLLIHA